MSDPVKENNARLMKYLPLGMGLGLSLSITFGLIFNSFGLALAFAPTVGVLIAFFLSILKKGQ